MGLEGSVPGGWRTGPTTFDRGPHATSRVIQFGDMVYGSYCGATYMGYGSCTYRTFIVGRKPTAKEQDWYKEVRDRLDAVIGEIKPGKTTADAAKHFPPATKWGYKSEVEILASEIGHGIGLGTNTGYDIPIINRLWSFDHPQVFEEGMTHRRRIARRRNSRRRRAPGEHARGRPKTALRSWTTFRATKSCRAAVTIAARRLDFAD